MNPMNLWITFPPASGNHQYGKGKRGRRYLKPVVLRYRLAVLCDVRSAKGLGTIPLIGPLEVTAIIQFPTRRKADLDNVGKVLL
jgi:Holliday junction resolvase RusA-like endonuclease